jgi:ribosomal protein S18 acetylase RimI-like enzyme
LPEAPLPAVITCIATTSAARRAGHAKRLVEEVCRDLAGRGWAAVEAYPDLTLSENEQSAARPEFWHELGFATAIDDERYPVMRREL